MDQADELEEPDEFVNKARLLENLKAENRFPKELYEGGKYLLFLGNEKVCLNSDDKLVFKGYEDIKKWNEHPKSTIVLLDVLSGCESNICLFAVDLAVSSEDSIKQIEGGAKGSFVDVRKCLFFLNNKESQYVTQARGLLHFCQSQKYCCYCGGKLDDSDSGHRKQCSSCKIIHYPNLSPVGLTLIEDENHEEVLLVRQKRHPPGMYTCVAGFVEPGESLEDNARREVAEEVGVKVTNVEYCISQHWALPACQLAMGCIAMTTSKQFTIDPKEIEHAQWVKAKDLVDAVTRTRQLKVPAEMDPQKLWAPPRNTVSHNLMVTWLTKYHNYDLGSR